MSKLSNKLNAYSDCERAFQAAASSNGSMLMFERRGSAVHWRQRAYRYRVLYREMSAETFKGIPGREHLRGTCPYDHLQIDIEEREDKWFCVIRPRDEPTLFDLDGNPIVTETVKEPDHDDII